MGGIIHVGGWEGLEYVDHDGPLVIFEPQRRAFQALSRNLGDRADVTLVHAAAGARTGHVTMFRVAPDHSSSLIEPGRLPSGHARDGEEDVLITTVDLIMNGMRLVGFDTLRIDTQGYELQVLKGAAATLNHLDRVEIEAHDPNVYPGAATVPDLDAFLTVRGFQRTALAAPGLDDIADVTYERVP